MPNLWSKLSSVRRNDSNIVKRESTDQVLERIWNKWSLQTISPEVIDCCHEAEQPSADFIFGLFEENVSKGNIPDNRNADREKMGEAAAKVMVYLSIGSFFVGIEYGTVYKRPILTQADLRQLVTETALEAMPLLDKLTVPAAQLVGDLLEGQHLHDPAGKAKKAHELLLWCKLDCFKIGVEYALAC